MEKTEQESGPFYNVLYNGRKYLTWSEADLIKEGVPQQKIDEVKCQQVKEARQAAYLSESDPLYIEWQFELASGNPDADAYKLRWLDKVAEIKLRIPLPTES